MKLSDSQVRALGRLDTTEWRGAREGVSGTTLVALADRGLAYVKWVGTPYRRLVGRLSDAGERERERRLAAATDPRADLDIVEGVLRNGDASRSARCAALDALERMRVRVLNA